jgi:hypothetical protein
MFAEKPLSNHKASMVNVKRREGTTTKDQKQCLYCGIGDVAVQSFAHRTSDTFSGTKHLQTSLGYFNHHLRLCPYSASFSSAVTMSDLSSNREEELLDQYTVKKYAEVAYRNKMLTLPVSSQSHYIFH